jgi:DNA-binding MarR family transcriptional regulator
MTRRLTFQVHRVNAKIAQIANPLFRIQQLDLLSSRILVLLLERSELRVGELVDEMVLPQSTISHQLQRLEKRKLLRRRRARDDNRAVAVSLTPKGLEVSGAEAAELARLLGKMFATLETFSASID